MMYLTESNLYFYSPFNNKTLIGTGTKLKIPFASISDMKMKRTLLIFPTKIKLYLESG